MSVVAEILRYPVVDGGQSHFRLFAGLHGHTDERRVGIGRFDFRVGFVVEFHRRAGLDGDLWVAIPWKCATGEPRCRGGVTAGGHGAPEVRRHPGGGGVSGRGAGRRVGATSGEAEALEIEELLGGRAARPSSVGSLRVRAKDGEILEPVETGEAVVHGGRVRPGDLILRVNRQPFLLKLVGNVGTCQNRHPGFVRAVRAEDGQKIFKSAFKVLFYLEDRDKSKGKAQLIKWITQMSNKSPRMEECWVKISQTTISYMNPKNCLMMRNFPTSGAAVLEEILCVHLLQSVPAASPLQGLSSASSLCATSAAGGGRVASSRSSYGGKTPLRTDPCRLRRTRLLLIQTPGSV